MRSIWEGACAGLTALGAGLYARERGWGPVRAAAAAAGTAFVTAWLIRQVQEKQDREDQTDEFL